MTSQRGDLVKAWTLSLKLEVKIAFLTFAKLLLLDFSNLAYALRRFFYFYRLDGLGSCRELFFIELFS